MEDRLARLEAELRGQRAALDDVLRRLAALESAPARPGRTPPRHDDAPAAVAARPAPPVSAAARAGTVPLLGRTLVALGGAYLLRALTEGGTLPAFSGVSLGLAYALAWVAIAWRAAGRGRSRSASFHLATAAATGLPLLWETTTRLGLLAPAGAAALLTLLALAMLAVCARRALHGAAWLTTLASLLTGFLLAAATPHGVAFTWALLATAVALLPATRRPGWQALAWVGALIADAGVLLVGVRTALTPASPHPGRVLSVQLALVLLYLGAFAWLLVRGRRPVDGFVLTQSAASLLMGYGGALLLARSSAALAPRLGLSSFVLGVASYALAFFGPSRERRPTFHLLGTQGLLFCLGGSGLLALGRPLAWIVLALALSLLGRLFGRRSLSLHGAAYLGAAAIASGGIAWTAVACLAPASHVLPPFPWPSLLVLGAGLAAMRLDAGIAPTHDWGRLASLPLSLLLATASWLTLGSALGALAASPLAGLMRDAGDLAVLRTALLALIAVALLLLARLPAFGVAVWLGRAALLLGGIKLLIDDLPHGRPSTLVWSLAIYGSALILGPRLGRRDPPRDAAAGRGET